MDTAVIEVDGLTRSFRTRSGTVEAVRGVDLRVDEGEIVALLGPNGAGKTTSLDVVLGLTEPTSGRVSVLGRSPRAAVREGLVSAVLQTGGLLADLTVAETVRFVASAYADPRPVDDVLERAGITALAGRRVSKCSGGEQQRLRFALALLPDPQLLILDEPTAGMDVTARRDFWTAMRAEADRGRTVVFATHYLEEADAFAQRIVMMSDGLVVADGTTEQIRSRATGRVVAADVADPAAAERALTAMGATVTAAGSRITARGGDADALARALLVDLGGHDLSVTTGSLDDAFVVLTQEQAR